MECVLPDNQYASSYSLSLLARCDACAGRIHNFPSLTGTLSVKACRLHFMSTDANTYILRCETNEWLMASGTPRCLFCSLWAINQWHAEPHNPCCHSGAWLQ
eukprot:scaffold286270_cov15-Tisochrysis_lutea.AAC.1